MFWKKVDCDGCNKKVRESTAIYHRGSYFCTAECRDSWTRANPPLTAKGEPDKLRRTLVETIDAAFGELAVVRGEHHDAIADAVGRMVPMIGKINAQHDAQDKVDAMARFQGYAYECIPLLNGLGFHEEVAAFDSMKPGSDFGGVIRALQSARKRAAV